jgi:hypothetical protein
VIIELVPATEGVRRQIIKSIHGGCWRVLCHQLKTTDLKFGAFLGRRLQVTPDLPSSPEMKDILASVLSDVSHSMSVPVCYTLNEWDVRSEIVRTDEVRLSRGVQRNYVDCRLILVSSSLRSETGSQT